MARFNTDGLNDLITDMTYHGQSVGAIADEMLIAGAEVVKTEWKRAAEHHNHRVTGDMINSIGYSRATKQVGDIKCIDIYPQGKDRHGERNAEKAFRVHYGTSDKTGSRFIDEADAASASPVEAVFRKIWNDAVNKK